MRRLAKYEIRKALSNRLFWIALPICVLIIALDVLRPWEPHFAFYRDLNNKNLAFLRELDRMGDGEFAEFHANMTDVFGADLLGSPPDDAYKQPGRYAARVGDESLIAADYARMRSERNAIVEGRRAIVANAERLGRKAEAAGDAYGARRNERIALIFANEADLVRVPTTGWNHYYSYRMPAILALFLVLLLCPTVFAGEGGFAPLLRSTRMGLRQTAGAKMLSASSLAFASSALLSLASLLAHH